MLNDPETLENIIAATPGLDKDPSVLGKITFKYDMYLDIIGFIINAKNFQNNLQQKIF